jgi:hypothetical protein
MWGETHEVFTESDFVLWWPDNSSSLDGSFFDSDDLLWRGVKTRASMKEVSNEIKKTFLDRWDSL